MACKYIPIFFDWIETTADLTQEQKGKLIDALVSYASEEQDAETILESLTVEERVAFRFLEGGDQEDPSDDQTDAGNDQAAADSDFDHNAEQNGTKLTKPANNNNNKNNNKNKNENKNEKENKKEKDHEDENEIKSEEKVNTRKKYGKATGEKVVGEITAEDRKPP